MCSCSDFKIDGRRATCLHAHYVTRTGSSGFRPREMGGVMSTNVVQLQTESEKSENDGRCPEGRVDRGESNKRRE